MNTAADGFVMRGTANSNVIVTPLDNGDVTIDTEAVMIDGEHDGANVKTRAQMSAAEAMKAGRAMLSAARKAYAKRAIAERKFAAFLWWSTIADPASWSIEHWLVGAWVVLLIAACWLPK